MRVDCVFFTSHVAAIEARGAKNRIVWLRMHRLGVGSALRAVLIHPSLLVN